jgi:NarL family two-component system response regulator LiaR
VNASSFRVVIIDDHPMIRAGIRAMLASAVDVDIAGEASTPEEAFKLVQETTPDVVLLDLGLDAAVDGIQTLNTLVENNPSSRVLVVTSSDDQDDVQAAFQAGATGYVLKDVTPEQMLNSIRAVAGGYQIAHPAIARTMQKTSSASIARAPRFDNSRTELSQREIEVMKLIGEGLNNRDIADRLVISESTVKTHVNNIFSKLGIADRSQAVLFAVRNGLVN